MRAAPLATLTLAALACLGLASCNPATADKGSAAKADLSSLSTEQQAAVKALIRETLVANPDILVEASKALQAQEQQKAMESVLGTASDITMGPVNAPVTVVEFFDYRCPYCHAAADYVLNLTDARKDVRVVFKEFPILSAESEEAARAAIAVHMQDKAKYPAFHRDLMAFRGDLNMAAVEDIAKKNGIDIARMKTDMASASVTQQIVTVREQAQQLGINGTPGFLVNGRSIPGFDPRAIDAAIDEAVKSAKG